MSESQKPGTHGVMSPTTVAYWIQTNYGQNASDIVDNIAKCVLGLTALLNTCTQARLRPAHGALGHAYKLITHRVYDKFENVP